MSKTTKEIIEIGCWDDDCIVGENPNKKWFSEEEVRRVIDRFEKYKLERTTKTIPEMADVKKIIAICYTDAQNIIREELVLEKEEKMSETISFDEQFPSLKDTKFVILWNSGEWTNGNFSRIDDTAVKCAMIKQCCLDKAKVREAINEIVNKKNCGTAWANTWKKEIFERLGL